jgi:NTP pyrophosphatase (non-canonical NTP hydrolase)
MTAIPAQATPDVMWAHVTLLVAWLDAASPRTDHEVACRVMKLAEETGEVVDAYLGWTGKNPRKGVCATRDDVTGELCDVIVTALVAMATITGDSRAAEATLQANLARRLTGLRKRVGDAPETEASRRRPGDGSESATPRRT